MIDKICFDILANPRSSAAYRRMSEYYKSKLMENESEAFLYLIERKFNADSSNLDKEQRRDNKKDT